jgi:hypothetical protein
VDLCARSIVLRGRIKKEKMESTSLDATVILLARLFSGLETLISRIKSGIRVSRPEKSLARSITVASRLVLSIFSFLILPLILVTIERAQRSTFRPLVRVHN